MYRSEFLAVTGLVLCLGSLLLWNGPARAEIDIGGAGLWVSVDMDKLFFIGCVAYGFIPGQELLSAHGKKIRKHHDDYDTLTAQLDKLEHQKKQFLAEHEQTVNQLMKTHPPDFEERLRKLDAWLDAKMEHLFARSRPIKKKQQVLGKHFLDDQHSFLKSATEAPEKIDGRIRQLSHEAARTAGAAVLINTSPLVRHRKPTPSQQRRMALLPEHPMRPIIRNAIPQESDVLENWWNLKEAFLSKSFMQDIRLPFILTGGRNITSRVSRMILARAPREPAAELAEPLAAGTTTIGPGLRHSPPAAVAVVDLEFIFLFHPAMADLSLSYGRFSRPIGSYLLPYQREQELKKRLQRQKDLSRKTAALEKRINKEIERTNEKLRRAKLALFDGRMAAQMERDRIIAGAPLGLVVDMKARENQQAVTPLKTKELPESKEARETLARKLYWETVTGLEATHNLTKAKLESDIETRQARLDEAREDTLAVMFLSREETRQKFLEILRGIQMVASSKAFEKRISVVLNSAYYRPSRLKKEIPVRPGADFDRKTEEQSDKNMLERFLEYQTHLLKIAHTDSNATDTTKDDSFEEGNDVFVNDMLRQWFDSRRDIAGIGANYMASPFILLGSVDITEEVLEALLAKHGVAIETIDDILRYYRERVSGETAE